MKVKTFAAITLASLVLISTQAVAKSQYYVYYVKSKPANGSLKYIGHHTYSCIKKKKGKHGRTIRNYHCFDQFHDSHGGKTRRKYYIKKSSKSKKLKKGAKCTITHPECNLASPRHYAKYGTCHQAANRFLYGAGSHAEIPWYIYGYKAYSTVFSTYRVYGKYGFGWDKCKRACYR